MTYPLKFRQQALAIREKENLTFAQTAVRFGVGIASVMRWAKNPHPARGHNKPATKIDMLALALDVEKHPEHYQYERAQRFGVSARGIGHALRRLGFTHKKNSPPSQSRRSQHRRVPETD